MSLSEQVPRVVLREESDGPDRRYLRASLSRSGELLLEGQDLGPSTRIVSDDGEYEWVTTVRAPQLTALRELLEIAPDEDLLVALEQRWSGARSHDLEAALRTGGVAHETHVF